MHSSVSLQVVSLPFVLSVLQPAQVATLSDFVVQPGSVQVLSHPVEVVRKDLSPSLVVCYPTEEGRGLDDLGSKGAPYRLILSAVPVCLLHQPVDVHGWRECLGSG